MNDADRFSEVIRRIVGRRLTYASCSQQIPEPNPLRSQIAWPETAPVRLTPGRAFVILAYWTGGQDTCRRYPAAPTVVIIASAWSQRRSACSARTLRGFLRRSARTTRRSSRTTSRTVQSRVAGILDASGACPPGPFRNFAPSAARATPKSKEPNPSREPVFEQPRTSARWRLADRKVPA
jgi:hypothetical protein